MKEASLSPSDIEKNLNRAKLLEWRLNPENKLHDPENQKLREPGNYEQRFNLRIKKHELEGKSKRIATQFAIVDEIKYIGTLEEKFHNYYFQNELSEGRVFLNIQTLRLCDESSTKLALLSEAYLIEANRLSYISEHKNINKPQLVRNPAGNLDLILNRSKNLKNLSEQYKNFTNSLNRENSTIKTKKHSCEQGCKNHGQKILPPTSLLPKP